MGKLEFFVVRRRGGYALVDASGVTHLDELFSTRERACDMAVRFAQDQHALYVIYA